MTKALKAALDRNLLSENFTTEVYSQGENRIIWHDSYFLHLFEVLDSGEAIYQTRPLTESWQFEDV